jgi:amino acid adenylation domain-containing protein
MSDTFEGIGFKYEEKLLHQMFVEQAAKTPDRVALIDSPPGGEYRSLTYQELDELTDKFSYWLRHQGVMQDVIVPIYMHKCLEFVIAYISILKAGGAYLPLEVGYPKEMMFNVLSETAPVVTLTLEKHSDALPKDCRRFEMNPGWQEQIDLNEEIINSLAPVTTTLESLAYCVYSSGTTGIPKGITCPHRGAVMSYQYREHTTPYHKDGSDREACNVFFVWELLRPLLRGAACVVIPDNVIYDPPSMATFLQTHQITRMLFTPSLCESILDSPVLGPTDLKKAFSSFRVVVLCGEVVTIELRNRIMAVAPNIELWNLYSISECHDVCVIDLAKVDPGTGENTKYCTTGQPIPGVEIIIIDEGNDNTDAAGRDNTNQTGSIEGFKAVPRGMPGEVYVSGPTLARGYLNRPELNAVRFPPRPMSLPKMPKLKHPGQDGPEQYTRLYKTGDWGRLLPDGGLEICGRHDSMQKIRGYSVEVLAVEAKLQQVPGITACVVTVVGEEGTDKHLAAFVVFDKPANSTNDSSWIKAAVTRTRNELKQKLMHYAVPSFFVPMEALPTHPISGKLNTKALPKTLPALVELISKNTENEGSETSNPVNSSSSTDMEATLSKIWAEVLELPLAVLDPDDSFFDQGGHSLRAAQLVAVLSTKLNRQVPVSALMQYPSIKLLTAYLEGDSKGPQGTHTADALAEELAAMSIPQNFDVILRAYWRGVSMAQRRPRSDSMVASGINLDAESVLLTGSTGFLGAYLLCELLTNTKVRTVYCLVRPSSDETVSERVINNLKKYRLWDDKKRWEQRLECIEGDASLTEFGLEKEHYSFLTTSTDRVLHAAAQVNLIYPYSGLRRANVVATRNIIQFAQDGKIKPLTYISTNSVFRAGAVDVKEDADLNEEIGKLDNGYAQTKWVAEQLVQRAAAQGLPATIFRPGNLAGPDPRLSIQVPVGDDDTYGGAFSSNAAEASGWNAKDSNWLIISGCVEICAAPVIPEWRCELTPVDFAAQTIITSLCSTETMGKCFNLVNPHSLRFQTVFDTMRASGLPIEALAYGVWKDRLKAAAAEKGGSLRNLWGLIEPLADETALQNNDCTTFDNSILLASNASLGIRGGAYPPLDVELVREYTNHWVDIAVLPKPIQPISRPLLGLVAVVTGASGGIGAGIARHLAEVGANVVLAARRKDRIESLAAELTRRYGVKCIGISTDVTKRDAVKSCITQTLEYYGRDGIDILVNNAGIMHYTKMKNLFEDQWEQAIDINCKGTLNGIGAVLPGMLARGTGHIINISSDAGRKVFPGLSVYSGTKFFVEAISQGLRLETAGTGVKVTTIQPGDCRSELSKQTTDEEARAEFAQSSQDRMVWLDPIDVARTVVFAASQPDHVAINEVLVEPRDAPA